MREQNRQDQDQEYQQRTPMKPKMLKIIVRLIWKTSTIITHNGRVIFVGVNPMVEARSNKVGVEVEAKVCMTRKNLPLVVLWQQQEQLMSPNGPIQLDRHQRVVVAVIAIAIAVQVFNIIPCRN